MKDVMQLLPKIIGTGEENATDTETLKAITGLSERELRKCIEQLRRSGCVIISASEGGYYKPATSEELSRFIHKEQSRACSVLVTLKSAKKLLREWGEVNG